MLINEMVKIIEQSFIERELLVIFANPVAYATRVMQMIKGDGKCRMVGNAYLMLEKHHGSGAALGFLITLEMLRKWARKRGDHNWLESQYEAIAAIDNEDVGNYVIPFIKNPASEILRLSQSLMADSLLGAFISCREMRWPGFETGAYLSIGLLSFSENYDSRCITLTE